MDKKISKTGIGDLLKGIKEKEEKFIKGDKNNLKKPKEKKVENKENKTEEKKEIKREEVVKFDQEMVGIKEFFSNMVKPENENKTNVMMYREQWQKFKMLADALGESQLNVYSAILDKFYRENEKDIQKVIKDYYSRF
jgi:hypothetical protein